MRFLTAFILSISLVTGAEPKPKPETQPIKKVKASRGKSFFRAVGAFGVGMLVVDPYTPTVPKRLETVSGKASGWRSPSGR